MRPARPIMMRQDHRAAAVFTTSLRKPISVSMSDEPAQRSVSSSCAGSVLTLGILRKP